VCAWVRVRLRLRLLHQSPREGTPKAPQSRQAPVPLPTLMRAPPSAGRRLHRRTARIGRRRRHGAGGPHAPAHHAAGAPAKCVHNVHRQRGRAVRHSSGRRRRRARRCRAGAGCQAAGGHTHGGHNHQQVRAVLRACTRVRACLGGLMCVGGSPACVMHTCMRVCVLRTVCMCACRHVCVYVHLQGCGERPMHVRLQACVCVCVCAC